MNPITGYATVPGTFVSEPILSAAATTITKTLVHTVTMNAATSTIAASGKGPSSSRAFAAPTNLFDKVTELYEHSPNYRFSYPKIGHMAPALRFILGAAVVGGIATLSMHLKNPPPVPPGEVPRTWKQKIRFAHNFLKGAATENEQLRQDIAKAHEDLARTHLEIETLEADGKMEEDSEEEDEELIKTKAENKVMHRQMNVYTAETMTLRARVTALELQNTEHPKVLQDLRDLAQDYQGLEHQLEDTESDKLQLEAELETAEQETDELRQQVEEVEKQKKTLISEHSSAVKASKELRVQLGRCEKEKDALEAKLNSAMEDSAGLQQQLVQLETDKNLLVQELKAAQQKPNQLHEQVTQLQVEKERFAKDLEQARAAQSSQQGELESVQKQRDDLQSLVDALNAKVEDLKENLQRSEEESERQDARDARDRPNPTEDRIEEQDELLKENDEELQKLKAENKGFEQLLDESNELAKGFKREYDEMTEIREQQLKQEMAKSKALEREIELLKAQQLHTPYRALHPRALLGYQPAFEFTADAIEAPTSNCSEPTNKQPRTIQPSTGHKLNLHASPPPVPSSVAKDSVKTEPDTTQNHEKMSLSQKESSWSHSVPPPVPETPTMQTSHASLISSPPLSSEAPDSNTPSKKRRRDLAQTNEDDDSTPRPKRRANSPRKSADAEMMQLDDPAPIVLDMINKPTFARPDAASTPAPRSSRISTAGSVRKSTRNTTKPQSYNVGVLGRAVSPAKDPKTVKRQARSGSPTKTAAKKTDEVTGTAKKQARSVSPSKTGVGKGSSRKT